MAEPQHRQPELSDIAVFIALIVLTVVTVIVSRLGLPRLPSFAVALAIAGVKASLVALYFMHMRFAVRPIYVIAIVPLFLTILVIAALLPDVGYNTAPMPPVDGAEAATGH